MPAREYRVIGTRPIRPDGYGKVTGSDEYGADIHLPGMLYAKVLRSPHPHAIIKSIDTSKAMQLPGVMAVITGEDMPKIESTEKIASGEESIEARFMTALALDQGEGALQGATCGGGRGRQLSDRRGGSRPDRSRVRAPSCRG